MPTTIKKAGEKTLSKTNSFDEIDAKLQKFLKAKGYDILFRTSEKSHGTFTYQTEKDEMPFWVKIGHSEGADKWEELGYKREDTEKSQGRIDDLKNEVAALIALWNTYPSGETDSFQFPPGPEEVFEDVLDDLAIYGYSRFVVEGKVLSKELRNEKTSFSEWIEPCVKIVKTIDTLPDLQLPRTTLKKQVNFEKLIEKNVSFWYDRLKLMEKKGIPNVDEELVKRADALVQDVRKFFDAHKIVMGSVHGDFQPDHLVFLEENGLPTLVQFSKLCQWYPRHWDIASMYGWVAGVLGDVGGAKEFWKLAISNGFSKEHIDYLKIITNVVTLGTISTFVEPGWEGGTLKVGVEAFVE